MPTAKPHLYKRIEKLADTVRRDFKEKGVVLPKKLKNGSVQIGKFIIYRKGDTHWIKDTTGYVIAGPINLAQTAAVLANDLALGRMLDQALLIQDRWYGYKAFDEQAGEFHITNALKNKDIDRADYIITRTAKAREQKLEYLRPIDARFAKLSKLT